MLQAEKPGWKSESLPLSLESRCYLNINNITWIFISCSDNIVISRALRCRNRRSRSALHIKGKATIEELWSNAPSWPRHRGGEQAERSPGARPAPGQLPGTARGRSDSAPRWERKRAPIPKPHQGHARPASCCHSTRGKGHCQDGEKKIKIDKVREEEGKKNTLGRKKTLHSIDALDSFFDLMLTLALHNSGAVNGATRLPSPSRDLGRATETRAAPGTALPCLGAFSSCSMKGSRGGEGQPQNTHIPPNTRVSICICRYIHTIVCKLLLKTSEPPTPRVPSFSMLQTVARSQE